MNRFIFKTTIILLLISCKQEVKLKMYELKGKVKTVTIDKYFTVERFGKTEKGDEISIRIYRFSSQGNIVEDSAAIHNLTPPLAFKNIYVYNEAGRLMEKSTYDEEGQLTKKCLSAFDDKGQKIEESCYNHSGIDVISKEVMKYNNNGYIAEKITYEDGFQSKTSWKYDKAGNPLERLDYYPDGKVSQKVTFEYDMDERLVKFVQFAFIDKVSNTSTYNYDEFDEEGNWRKKITFFNGKPSAIEYRIISYY